MMDLIWATLHLCIFIASAVVLFNKVAKRIPYRYSSLPPGHDNIRLLRLIPNKHQTAVIKCQLFDYSLKSGKGTHLYEALSYVWGNPYKTVPIFIGGHRFKVTENLHAALLHLRNHSIERIIWVDAVCINQADKQEKEHQIRFMAKIYAQANRVIVWLGEAADDSDQALEKIRVTGGGKRSSNSSSLEMNQQAVPTLLQRPWFRRIWVLQEVAAARQISIMCGSTEIDGYAFCSGVGPLNLYEDDPGLQSLIRSVTYLIKGAIFRTSYAISGLGRSSLDICPLGELIDMYHTHEATERHDKVYALLGMSSNNVSNNDLSKAGLSPNYRLPFEELFRNLIQFLLYNNVSVETLGHKQTALIKSKGCVLGKVSSVQNDISWGNNQGVVAIFKNTSRQPVYMDEQSTHWILHASAKSIQDGDLVCLLQGASKPTIIRLCNGHFDIVLITASPPKAVLKSLQSIKAFYYNFSLIWDWENLPRELLQTNDWASEHSEIEFEDHLGKATRRWNFAIILEDLEEYDLAQENIQEAIEGYERAAAGGGEAMVKQLLGTGEVEVDFKHKNGTTPLWWAAKAGHDTIVKLLLQTGEVSVGAKHKDGTTPLQAAAGGGHLAVVERLLEEKADVNAAAAGYSGRTALQAAAEGGHVTVVERLRQAGALG